MTQCRSIRRAGGGAIVTALVGIAVSAPASAGAATLVADYQFNDSRASSLGAAPSMEDLGPGPNAFATESVRGATERVLTFAADSGISLATNSLVPANDYSVVLTMRRSDLTSYQRILNFSGPGDPDYGLYSLDGDLNFYDSDSDHRGDTAPLAANVYAEIAFTRDPTKALAGYVNGTIQFAYTDLFDADDSLLGGTVTFFKDNGVEDAAGAVARIRLYSGALTAAEVASIAAGVDPTLVQPPTPCKVPKLRRKKLSRAKQLLEAAHCSKGKVRRRFSGRVKRKRVISQRPAPGTTGPAGLAVKLKVSKGPRPD